MRNLLAFLAKYYYWFVFIVLEVVSSILLFSYNSYQGSFWFTSANAVTGKIYEWESKVQSYFSLSSVNAALSQRNLVLEKQIAALNEQVNQVKKDSTAAGTITKNALMGYKLIPAKVITNSTDQFNNLITIDKGAADGVKKDMGVACGEGVVGIVYLVSAHYSIVIPVLNSHSHISCIIQKRGYFGSLRWKHGHTMTAYVDDVPRHARFNLYDRVVTSGYSSIFPPGISVGKIIHVYNSPDGLSYRLMVQLSTNFSTLRDVCVIDNYSLEERQQLMQAANDSIKANENNSTE